MKLLKSNDSKKVFSFDVFDTVLTRTISPPSAVFFVTARRARSSLPDACTPDQFSYLRQRAEKNVISWKGWGVTLLDIYHELRNSLNVSKAVAERIMEIELSVERDVLYPIPQTQLQIERLREHGASIVFTSDMYLPSDYIQTLLLEHGIWQTEDQLFVSSDYGVLKHRGELFQPLLQQLDSKGTVIHIGNTYESDIEGAEAAGIASHHVTLGNANRYEEILEQYTQETAGMSGAMAGASRHARLHTHAESAHEEALRDVTAGVMAPALVGFVMWLLGRAERQNLECLYFTSRDGYHLVPMAQRLASLLGVDCEFEYLYLSRASVSAAHLDPEKIKDAWEKPEKASGEELLARLGLSIEEVEGNVSRQEVAHLKTEPVSRKGKEVIQKVANNERERLKKNRENICRYVRKKEISEKKSGFVDIGWRGTIHGYLNDVLVDERILSEPLPGFFFGLASDQQMFPSYRTAYFFDQHRGMGYKPVLLNGEIFTLMEVFCTAKHGTVTGYEREEARVSPTHEPRWPDRMEEWGFPVVERTLDSFLDGLTRSEELLSCQTDVRVPTAELLRTFWTNPTRKEASAWGAFPSELGQGEGRVEPLAEPYDEWTAPLKFAMYGRDANTELKHKGAWMQGALARSNPLLRGSIEIALQTREGVKYVLFGIAQRLGLADRLASVINKWT